MSSSKAEKYINEKNKEIEARNAKFQALPLKKQRMEIAREILSLLDQKGVSPTRGTYFSATVRKDASKLFKDTVPGIRDTVPDLDWQKLLPKLSSCRVCSIGIAVYSTIKLRDGVRFRDKGYVGVRLEKKELGISSGECFDILDDLFEYDEINFMEQFFENDTDALSPRESMELFWGHILKNEGEIDEDSLYAEYDNLARAKRKRKVST